MAEKKQEDFVVTDKRKFTLDGEMKRDVPNEEEPPVIVGEKPKTPPSSQATAPQPPRETPPSQPLPEAPPPPTNEERAAQQQAYQQSSKDMGDRIRQELGGTARDYEMNFERFVASLYMTALMQLGLVHEQGMQPQLDIIAARQTIDTLGILVEKTKGNLTMTEENLLQNCLYELRMAYIEVTNALTRPPQEQGPDLGKK